MAENIILYLDTCCYGRPLDDLGDTKVRLEVSAIAAAINICRDEGFPIIGSPMLELEINEIKDLIIRQNIMQYYRSTATEKTPLTDNIERRAKELQVPGGLRRKDAYHAALAESAGVTYLLTTDPKFVNAAARLGVKTKVINPINFLQEYYKCLQQ